MHIFPNDGFLLGLDDDVLSRCGAHSGKQQKARGGCCKMQSHDRLLSWPATSSAARRMPFAAGRLGRSKSGGRGTFRFFEA
jgi:hypothetical protein